MFLNNKNLSAFLCLMIVFQIIFQPVVAEMALANSPTDANSMTSTSYNVNGNSADVKLAVADAVIDPAITDILADKTFPLGLDLSPNDPIVDQDPFYLNSQSWKKQIRSSTSDAGEEDAAFTQSGDSTFIALAGIQKIWQLRAPIHPVFKTDEFIFFSANADSDLFARVQGAGLFFVSYNQLISASVKSENIPVHFFPMPGSGWQTTHSKEISGSEIPHRDIVVFQNTEGLSLPILTADLRAMVKVQSLNMTLATSLAMDEAIAKLDHESPKLEEARHRLQIVLQDLAKAGAKQNDSEFGANYQKFEENFRTLVSKAGEILGGTELKLPRGSTAGFGIFFTGFDLDHPNSRPYFENASNTSTDYLQKFTQLAFDMIGISTAQAATPVLADVFHHVNIVVAKCAFVYAVGLGFRYWGLRKTIEAKMREGAAIGKTHTQVSFTVFANSLTFLYQLPYVWPANLFESVMDYAGTSENGTVRNLFNATFGFARKSNTRTPVNYKTLALGVGVLGIVDTGLVGFQQYIVIPWIAHHIARLGPFFATRVEAAWAVGGTMALYSLISVIYNFVGYLTAGANALASSVQEKSLQESLGVVAKQMREEGIDPENPKNKKLFDAQVKARVRNELTRQGLPGEDAFLFDANSLYRNIQSFFGYNVPPQESADQEPHSPEEFYAITRQGLNIHALNRAYQSAIASGNQGAIRVLRSARTDFSLLRKFASDPTSFLTPSGIISVAKAYRRVRSELTAFSLTGVPNEIGLQVSGSWIERGDVAGAQQAALLFRRELFGLLQQNQNGVSDVTAGTATAEFDPLKLEGGYARRQLVRAYTKANQKFTSQMNMDVSDLFSGELDEGVAQQAQKRWEEIYRVELLKQAGLRVDYGGVDLINSVDAQTEKDFGARVATDLQLSAYLSGISSAQERMRIEQTIKNDLFAQNYVSATVTGEGVAAMDPQQPGIFQSIRQLKWVRDTKIETALIRLSEGLTSDTHYRRGRYARFARTTPIISDTISANQRELRKTVVEGTVRWLYLNYVWSAALPWKGWAVNQMFRGSTISGPWTTTQRALAKLGMKPGSKFTGMLAYGFIGSWATFTGGIFYGLFSRDIQNGFKLVAEPIVSAGLACGQLLSHAFTHVSPYVSYLIH